MPLNHLRWLSCSGLFHSLGWVAGGLHLIVLFLAIKINSVVIWSYSLAVMAVLSFLGWAASYQRYRVSKDTPTSKIASAAQGYVEVYGRAAQIAGQTTKSPLSMRPCCWYRYVVEKKRFGTDWQVIESGVSSSQFLLIDSTGECVVYPDGAEVASVSERVWVKDDRRVSEWWIPEHVKLYVIGKFSTNRVQSDPSRKRTIFRVLHEYQGAFLSKAAGASQPGEAVLSPDENLHKPLFSEAAPPLAYSTAKGWTNQISKPDDGRVFLIAAKPPATVWREYRLISWVHLAVCFLLSSGSFILSS
jgi:hypothetical protein